MTIRYIHLAPGASLQKLSNADDFDAALVLVGPYVADPDWRNEVCDWIIARGCVLATAWGDDSFSWDDTLDWAHLESKGFEEVGEEEIVMTLWVNDDRIQQGFFTAKHAAAHPYKPVINTVILDINFANREHEMLRMWTEA